MTISYRCRHCDTEVGRLPFEKLPLLQKSQLFELGKIEDFIEDEKDGRITIQCICEQCEKALQTYPNYHELKRWLQ